MHCIHDSLPFLESKHRSRLRGKPRPSITAGHRTKSVAGCTPRGVHESDVDIEVVVDVVLVVNTVTEVEVVKKVVVDVAVV